jgi:hypothetical protein
VTSTSLAQAIQSQREATLLHQAETIRDWPSMHERQQQAEIHVRMALSERRLGRISEQVQQKVYSILNFALLNKATYMDVSMPLPELESERDIEAAYYQQLERRSCPECGDGICPVDDERRTNNDQ